MIPKAPTVLTLLWEMPAFCTAHSVSMNQLRYRGWSGGGLRMLSSAEQLALAARRNISTRPQTVWLPILLRSRAVRVSTVQ